MDGFVHSSRKADDEGQNIADDKGRFEIAAFHFLHLKHNGIGQAGDNGKKIARAIRKVHDAEPNLFKPAGDDGDDDNGAGGSGNGFRGKGPGGAGSTKNGELEAKKAEALEMLGIKKDDKK